MLWESDSGPVFVMGSPRVSGAVDSHSELGGLFDSLRRPDESLGPRWLSKFTSRSGANVDLIAALNDVASAVSSTTSLDEVLETIVERAKRITNTEKAALILTVDHSLALDDETLVVRGSRDEHPQEWWSEQMRLHAEEVFESGTTYLSLDVPNAAWLMCAPIRVKAAPVGLLAAINSRDRKFSAEQQDFLAILGAFAATAIENARLAEQNKYVLLASERDRIAREMHDGISQSLFSVALGLEVCKKMMVRDPSTVAGRLDELQQMVDLSRSELRRFIYDLRPLKLQELGLVGAIEYWIHEVTIGDHVVGDIHVTGEQRTLTPALEACLYRVAKESISNVVRHAGATRFRVELDYHETDVQLSVVDDGVGFDVAAARRERGDEGIGLKSIEDRIKRAGGEIEFHSSVGSGTRIRASIPVRD